MDHRKVRYRLMELGWTRKEFKRRLGFAEGTMQNILTGANVSPRTAYKVASLLGMKLSDLQKISPRSAISQPLRFLILLRDGFKCFYCGRGPEDGTVLQLDHIWPVAEGGSNEAENVVAACATCNRGKGDGLMKPGVIEDLFVRTSERGNQTFRDMYERLIKRKQ